MNWEAIFTSPIPYLVLVLVLVIIFRKPLSKLIERITKAEVEVDKAKGVKAGIEAVEPETPSVVPPPTLPAMPRPIPAPPPPLPPRDTLPAKAYHQLIGRQEEMDKVMAALREPEKRRMTVIDGLGGIGKTALAREVTERCCNEGLFEHIVWVSARLEKFEGEGIQRLPVSDLTLEGLLDEIGRQCNRPDIVKMKHDEKESAVKALLSVKRVLIVVDNLDTVREHEAFVARLHAILGRGKVLFTSRYKLKSEYVYAVSLGGLNRENGVSFLREEGRERGIEVVAEAPTGTLEEIHAVTGGAPLAMKLGVGQMSRQTMSTVLDSLREASFEGQDYLFYRFVYERSWDLLSMDAKKVLVSMSTFAPVIGGTEDAVIRVSDVGEKAFRPAIDQSVTMSLVDVVGSLGRQRYALHQLTHYFILSDIVKKWG